MIAFLLLKNQLKFPNKNHLKHFCKKVLYKR